MHIQFILGKVCSHVVVSMEQTVGGKYCKRFHLLFSILAQSLEQAELTNRY